jgi:integrase
MPITKLTKSNVDKLVPTQNRQTLYHDSEMPGFLLCVGKNTKTYFVQSTISGRPTRIKIGRHGVFTPEQARASARDLLYKMSKGENPLGIKRGLVDQRLCEVLDRYIEVRANISKRTSQDYRSSIRLYCPDWKSRSLRSLTKEEILARHRSIGENHGKYAANKTMRVVRALFNFAVSDSDEHLENPVGYLGKIRGWYRETRRQTVLTRASLKTWYQGVVALENPDYRDLFLILLFTGLRRAEALSLCWENIDLTNATITIPSTKNGAALVLPVSTFVLSILLERSRSVKSAWVFPSSGQSGHLVEPKRGYRLVRESTGVEFNCHDLRRTFMTIAESLDISVHAIKRLVNHKQSDVTGGYIILSVERLREPVEKLSCYLLEKFGN